MAVESIGFSPIPQDSKERYLRGLSDGGYAIGVVGLASSVEIVSPKMMLVSLGVLAAGKTLDVFTNMLYPRPSIEDLE